ncbi:MAG: hypothetical protein ACFFDN_13940 [Candidatus Hodarchaeota archaeon]
MIHNVWILNTNGICLLDRNYSSTDLDRNLVAGFVSAIESFSKKLTQRHVDSILMGDIRILYIVGEKIIVAIAIDAEDDEEEIRRKVEALQRTFVKMYENKIHLTEVDVFKDFTKIIDMVLYLDWNFEYDRKLQQKSK